MLRGIALRDEFSNAPLAANCWVGIFRGANVTAQVPETEHAVSEHAVRDRHQLRTLAAAIVALSAVFGGVIVTIVYAHSLNRLWFLNFPLGFYLLAQGLLIFAIVVAFWYVRVQERIDHTRNLTEELS
jgi:putative solute:sodium symporter small subunit